MFKLSNWHCINFELRKMKSHYKSEFE